MSFTQRLTFFILGIVLGSVLAGYLMQQRRIAAEQHQREEAAVAPVGAEAIQRTAVPGIMAAYNQRRVPMHSEFIKNVVEVADAPRTGLTERYLLLRGMEPEQVLGICEVAPSDADKVWGKLLDVRIFAADRLQVRVPLAVSRAQLAAALEPLGIQIVRGLPANSEDPSALAHVEVEGQKGIRLETPADIEDTNLYLVSFPLEGADGVLRASDRLSRVDLVASIAFDYLDADSRFKAPADVASTNSGQ